MSLLPCLILGPLSVDIVQASDQRTGGQYGIDDETISTINESCVNDTYPFVSTTRSINAPVRPATISLALLGKAGGK